jgi:hypothetical protein
MGRGNGDGGRLHGGGAVGLTVAGSPAKKISKEAH